MQNMKSIMPLLLILFTPLSAQALSLEFSGVLTVNDYELEETNIPKSNIPVGTALSGSINFESAFGGSGSANLGGTVSEIRAFGTFNNNLLLEDGNPDIDRDIAKFNRLANNQILITNQLFDVLFFVGASLNDFLLGQFALVYILQPDTFTEETTLENIFFEQEDIIGSVFALSGLLQGGSSESDFSPENLPPLVGGNITETTFVPLPASICSMIIGLFAFSMLSKKRRVDSIS